MKVTSHLHPVLRSRTYITAFSNIFSEYDADFSNTRTSLFLPLFLYLYTLSSFVSAELSQVFYFVTFLRKFVWYLIRKKQYLFCVMKPYRMWRSKLHIFLIMSLSCKHSLFIPCPFPVNDT